MGVLGKWLYAVGCIGVGPAPCPAQRGAGPLPGAAVRPKPGDVQPWGGVEGPCLAPGMVGGDQAVGAEPLQSGEGPADRQQGGGSGHGRDAGE